MTTANSEFTVALSLRDGYAFNVEFDDGEAPPLVVDELPPLGEANGPNPARLLAAAVGSCLGSSLLFCLRKARIEPANLRTTVQGTIVRNARGRMRIESIRVRLAPELTDEQRARMGRCLDLFQDFCLVTESVREGITVDVEVEGAPVAAAVLAG
ncbi:MAG TPA: OsmC family protein [Gemmatimonadales bacterium]|nr:OsmC family protein [Gemmatimonadales bacterium]